MHPKLEQEDRVFDLNGRLKCAVEGYQYTCPPSPGQKNGSDDHTT